MATLHSNSERLCRFRTGLQYSILFGTMEESCSSTSGTPNPSPFSVSAFYSRKSRPDDFEGDEFSEDSVDDSDRDKAYVQEDISDSSEYESDELIGTTRQSVSPSPSPTPSSVLQRSPTPSPRLRLLGYILQGEGEELVLRYLLLLRSRIVSKKNISFFHFNFLVHHSL